ncbi:MAG: DUF5110 domain-containing protein [Rikenellaceae bacterium]|nr:DUF5110 domain-containing protein [Rikenellaceae bacterium]
MKRLIVLLLMLPLAAAAQPMEWTEIFPGIWKGVAGRPEAYDLLTAAECEPFARSLERLERTPFPFDPAYVNAEVSDGNTYLRFPLERDEQIYGLGLNFQTVHQRGRILGLHVDHYGGRDNGRTHAPVPFYVSSAGYGVLVNSARYMTFYIGTAVRSDARDAPRARDRNTDSGWTSRPYSDAVEVYVPAEGVEVYLFSGGTPLGAVERYNLFCGGGALPPRWGLGFTQRVEKLSDAAQVVAEAEEFERRGYPLDFIGLEPGWQSRAYPCTFEWDTGRFPDPAGLTRQLLDRGVRLNLWMNPYVSPEASIYNDILPHTGTHTVWCGVVPDLNDPEAVRIWTDRLRQGQVDTGVSGYKIDEVDGYDHYLWPDVARFPSGTSADQMRQTYGVLAQKVTARLYRDAGMRTFGLVRASNAGANNMPYVLYNDYYSHPDFITALVNSGFCGVLWTPEVRSSKTAEEWLRRFQSVVFSPMAMINAWSSGTKPWSFPEVAGQVKYYAELRMMLMPYFYSEFARYRFEGTPPFRAMALEPGFRYDSRTEAGSRDLEDNPYLEAVTREVKDQYMAGKFLLVAPMFAGQTSRTVILPQGNWYNFYTGRYAGNGEEITVEPGLDFIPVYVRDGSVIPFMQPLLHSPGPDDKVDIEFRHYGNREGSYRLYDDDGTTFAYEDGLYSWRTATVSRNACGELTGSLSDPEEGKPNTVGRVTFRFMTRSE